MNTPKLFLDEDVINLFKELADDEVIRIELMNGSKIYYLPSDYVFEYSSLIKIIKPIKKNKIQQIIINPNAIAVICTMSRETYELKLSRCELYV